ncbi:MAG: hypothetical protein FJW40_02380 [Acidobacteria bacterium]|nr:hypothetical protein [Acidobacteriota bacterium]
MDRPKNSPELLDELTFQANLLALQTALGAAVSPAPAGQEVYARIQMREIQAAIEQVRAVPGEGYEKAA